MTAHNWLSQNKLLIRTINLGLPQFSESIFNCCVVRDAGPYNGYNQTIWNLMHPSQSYLPKLSSNFWNSLDLGVVYQPGPEEIKIKREPTQQTEEEFRNSGVGIRSNQK